MILPICEAKVRAGVDTEFNADFFVGCNYVFLCSLIKCWVVWQSAYTLDPTYLVQYTPDCKVDVKEIKQTQLLRFRMEPEGNSISREIPQPVVAHHNAKFSCCGQKLRFGPLSHILANIELVNLICVFLKISLNLVVKNSVGVT